MSLIELLDQTLERNNTWSKGWLTFWFFICRELNIKKKQQAKRLLSRLCRCNINGNELSFESLKNDIKNDFKHSFTG